MNNIIKPSHRLGDDFEHIFTDYDVVLKLLIIGDSSVGKSAMLTQYHDEKFTEGGMSTIGVDFNMKTIEIEGKRIKLQIWDTAGQERFKTITQSYYRGAEGIMIVYDVTDIQSFEHVRYWLNEVDRLNSDAVPKILVGNKSDLIHRKLVTFEQGKSLADSCRIPFLETSAKSGSNIDRAFESLALASAKQKRDFFNLSVPKKNYSNNDKPEENKGKLKGIDISEPTNQQTTTSYLKLTSWCFSS